MASARVRRALMASLLLVTAACSGSSPSQPSNTTPAAPPVSTPHGTIALVSANPAPGADLTVDPARPDQTLLTATFSVTFDAAVANGRLVLQLLDAGSQVCGSAQSESQPLTAGQAKTFTVTVTALSCASGASIENLKAALVNADAASTEYVAGTFAAHYAIRPPKAALALSGIVTEPGGGPIAGARIDVEEGVNLGRFTTTDAGGRYTLADLSAGTFSVRASKDGYDNSHIRVTLGAGSLTQDFSISRAPVGPPRSGAFTFLGSDPASGAEFSVVESAGLLLLPLKVQFAIQFETAIPDAKVEVDLLNDAGQRCAYAFVDQPIAANQSVTMANTFWVWDGPLCSGYPVGTTTIKTTLLTLRGPEINGHLQRIDWAASTFPARYSVRRYPPPPGGPETPPSISALTWKVPLPVGGDPPIPGDPVTITCTAKESDGAPLTTTITLTWDTLPPQRYTEAFPAGASSSSGGASYAIGVTAPTIPGGAPNARVACLTANDRGQTASKTTDIGKPK